MTTRRGLLKLLAAAPIIAPLAVRSMKTPRWASGGLVSGEAFLQPIMIGEATTESILTHDQFRALSTALDNPCEPNARPSKLKRSTSPWDAPNRLHGAYINDDGDAV